MTDGAQKVPAGWEGILDPGETILWQGRPDSSLRMTWSQVPEVIFAGFFTGFAIFWMIMAGQMDGLFWMFGLLHFGVGIAMLARLVFWQSFVDRYTWYTLTNQHAFIATNLPYKAPELESYPVTPTTELRLITGTPGSIHFAKRRIWTAKGTRALPSGFDRIEAAETVWKLMRSVQQKEQA